MDRVCRPLLLAVLLVVVSGCERQPDVSARESDIVGRYELDFARSGRGEPGEQSELDLLADHSFTQRRKVGNQAESTVVGTWLLKEGEICLNGWRDYHKVFDSSSREGLDVCAEVLRSEGRVILLLSRDLDVRYRKA